MQMNFDSCLTRQTTYPCSIFSDRHPSTVAMTVLVVVEMFNALNNLSENQSLMSVLLFLFPYFLFQIKTLSLSTLGILTFIYIHSLIDWFDSIIHILPFCICFFTFSQELSFFDFRTERDICVCFFWLYMNRTSHHHTNKETVFH